MSTDTLNKPRTRNEWDGILLQLGLNPNHWLDVCNKLDNFKDQKQVEKIRAELTRLCEKKVDPTGYLKYLRFGFQQNLTEVA